MTGYEVWGALAAASHHILAVAEPEPDRDADWNAVAMQHFGAPLRSHHQVALDQLATLAARLDAEDGDADMRAGIRALRLLVEQGHAQGAFWLARAAADSVLRADVMSGER